jgi:hypothetical protein
MTDNFRILILEDDFQQAEWVVSELKSNAPKLEVSLFTSENAIMGALDAEVVSFRPHLFLLDRLVRAYSREEIEVQPSITRTGFGSASEAGLRVARRIRDIPSFNESPIIVWSVMEPPKEISIPLTLCLQKAQDMERLILAVRSVAAAVHEPLPPKQKSKLNSVASAADLKPSFMGMSIDLKKLWAALTGG